MHPFHGVLLPGGAQQQSGADGIDYPRSLADSASASDVLDRAAVYGRALADSASAADVLARVAAYTRPLDDPPPPFFDDFSTDQWAAGRYTLVVGTGLLQRNATENTEEATTTAEKKVFLDWGRARYEDVEASVDHYVPLEGSAHISPMIKGRLVGGGLYHLKARYSGTNSGINIQKFVGGVTTDLVAYNTLFVRGAGWKRTTLKAVGNVITASHYALDANRENPVHNATETVTLTGQDAVDFGAGVWGSVGRRWVPGATDWRADNFRVTPLPAVISGDSLARIITAARGLDDAAPATDALVAGGGSDARALADSAPAADAIARLAAYTRPLADAASGADAASRSSAVVRAASDSAAATDALARTGAYARALADAGVTTDSLVRLIGYARALTDAAAATDSLVRVLGAARGLTDAAPAAEALLRAAVYLRALSDAAPASDTLSTGGGQVRALSDIGSGADSLARVYGGGRALVDVGAAVDSLARMVVYQRLVSDAVGGVDALVRVAAALRALVDGAPASDSLLVPTADKPRGLADTAPASDALVRMVDLGRMASDVATTNDGLLRSATFWRAVLDAGGGSDVVGALSDVGRVIRMILGDKSASALDVGDRAVNRVTVSDA